MLPTVFQPELHKELENATTTQRTTIIKGRMQQAYAALPPIVHRLSDMKEAPVDMDAADHLAELRQPRVNGTTDQCSLPFNWFYARGEGGQDAPVYSPQRMHILDPLVAAYCRTGEMKYAQAARDYIVDYVSQYYLADDKSFREQDWMDAPLRCSFWYGRQSIYIALKELHALPIFSGDDLVDIFRAITHMMNWTIPMMPPGGNQRMFGLQSLFTAGMCYPFLSDAHVWLDTGVTGINEEFEADFLPDGCHGEQTPGYGASVWEMFTRSFALACEEPKYGFKLEPSRFETIQEYYLSCLKPNGKHAAFGDVWTIRGGEELDRDSKPCKHLGGLADAPWQCVRKQVSLVDQYTNFDSSRFILNGSPKPSWTTRMHDNCRHLFMRNGWEWDSLYMNLQLGHHAGWHSHTDMLGLEVAGYGRELLVDPGNSDYSGHPINVNFRMARAHNTMTLEGLDQLTGSPVQLYRLAMSDHYDFALGYYNGGYVNSRPFKDWQQGSNASHCRHVLFVKPPAGLDNDSYWLVVDAMLAPTGHTAETRMHFMPTNVQQTADGGYCTGYEEGNLALVPLEWDEWESRICLGQDDPVEGWLPTPQREYIPAPAYKATSPTTGKNIWHSTLLWPYRCQDRPAIEVSRTDLGEVGLGFEIRAERWTDILVVSKNRLPLPFEIGPVASDSLYCHVRLIDRKPSFAYSCDGNYMCVDGKEVFRR